MEPHQSRRKHHDRPANRGTRQGVDTDYRRLGEPRHPQLLRHLPDGHRLQLSQRALRTGRQPRQAQRLEAKLQYHGRVQLPHLRPRQPVSLPPVLQRLRRRPPRLQRIPLDDTHGPRHQTKAIQRLLKCIFTYKDLLRNDTTVFLTTDLQVYFV